MNQAHGTTSGFTLLEVLIVLIIAGMALGLVLTRGPPRAPGLESRVAIASVAQSLRLARARAIATNRPVRFVLDTETGGWRVGDGPAKALPPTVSASMLTVAGETAGPRGAILFAPDGSSSGGRIVFAEGAIRRSLAIDWLTGRVTERDAAP